MVARNEAPSPYLGLFLQWLCPDCGRSCLTMRTYQRHWQERHGIQADPFEGPTVQEYIDQEIDRKLREHLDGNL